MIALTLVGVALLFVIIVSFAVGLYGAVSDVSDAATGGGIGYLVGVVLFVALAIYWIYLMAKRGDEGPNRFGTPS